MRIHGETWSWNDKALSLFVRNDQNSMKIKQGLAINPRSWRSEIHAPGKWIRCRCSNRS